MENVTLNSIDDFKIGDLVSTKIGGIGHIFSILTAPDNPSWKLYSIKTLGKNTFLMGSFLNDLKKVEMTEKEIMLYILENN